jgi:hypothetical protein
MMNRREIAEARYDTMPDAVAEQVYGDPLVSRLEEAEGQVRLMARLIRECIYMIRFSPFNKVTAGARRFELRDMLKHRRIKQAEARELRLVIAARDAQLGLSAAQ